ncbi:hypothetical protein NL492_26630, partial [Klebsiella pneumoniae]|nr:hypothetical protein [Klebsiella pneumoniae]
RECHRQLTSIGKFEINPDYTGIDAFRHGLYGLTKYRYKRFANDTKFLRQYHQELFNRAIMVYTKDMIQSGIAWCLDHLKEFEIDLED